MESVANWIRWMFQMNFFVKFNYETLNFSSSSVVWYESLPSSALMCLFMWDRPPYHDPNQGLADACNTRKIFQHLSFIFQKKYSKLQIRYHKSPIRGLLMQVLPGSPSREDHLTRIPQQHLSPIKNTHIKCSQRKPIKNYQKEYTTNLLVNIKSTGEKHSTLKVKRLF